MIPLLLFTNFIIMKKLQNRSMYEDNRDWMVNELQKLGFSRKQLVSAGENDLYYLYSTMVKDIWISEEKRQEYLNKINTLN